MGIPSSRSRVVLLSMLVAGLFFGAGLSAKASTWSKILSGRYQLLANFNGQAVLDRETGLIWEQCPGVVTVPWIITGTLSGFAIDNCYTRQTGGRMGWRLPTYEELLSLGDPSTASFLPKTAPFCNTISGTYWTSTTPLVSTGGAYIVAVDPPDLQSRTAGKESGTARVWCVRGGATQDLQFAP